MKRFTNIFIGNIDLNTLNNKNKQIKIFEGQYCKTFFLVDKDNFNNGNKLEVKNFNTNSNNFKRLSKGKLNSNTTKIPKIPYSELNTLTSNKKLKSGTLSPLRLPILKKESISNMIESNRKKTAIFKKKNDFNTVINTENTVMDADNHIPLLTHELDFKQFTLTKGDNFSPLFELENKYGLKIKSVKGKK